MGISIFFFAIMTALSFTAIFYGYDYFNFLGYQLNENRYQWVLVVGLVLNIFTTFLHEGVSGFEKWKATLTETEQLKREYIQSCLLGLKSQVNPHFLFNSLNSLSSLIHEDEKKAEDFLNEMSKVYRYLLRNNEEKLVKLNTELQFIQSYYYILRTRYGEGIQIDMNIEEKHKEMCIPPLTIQILLENAFNLNRISKDKPLIISITSLNDCWLQIKNNVQHKIGEDKELYEEGLENIVNKFKLLCQQTVRIRSTDGHRYIEMPLIKGK
jgi:LytS/YehU family sensor histidine kinase